MGQSALDDGRLLELAGAIIYMNEICVVLLSCRANQWNNDEIWLVLIELNSLNGASFAVNRLKCEESPSMVGWLDR